MGYWPWAENVQMGFIEWSWPHGKGTCAWVMGRLRFFNVYQSINQSIKSITPLHTNLSTHVCRTSLSLSLSTLWKSCSRLLWRSQCRRRGYCKSTHPTALSSPRLVFSRPAIDQKKHSPHQNTIEHFIVYHSLQLFSASYQTPYAHFLFSTGPQNYIVSPTHAQVTC